MSRWKFENDMSRAHFSIPYMLFSKAEGCFEEVSGSLNYDPYRPEGASVEAVIRVDSLRTPVQRVDEFLRTRLLNAPRYPTMTFRSDRVRFVSDDIARITGKLKIRRVTYPITFEAAQFAEGYTDAGQKYLQFQANATLNREAFDLGVQSLRNSLIGHSIAVTLDVTAVLQTEQAYS